MNWRRGLLRFWVVLTVGWVASTFLLSYRDLFPSTAKYVLTDPNGHRYEITTPLYVSESDALAFVNSSGEVEARKRECDATPRPWCNDALVMRMPGTTSDVWPFVLISAIPPLAVLILIYVLRWVLASFRKEAA